ncbi:MAG TPA: hypothetical protein V6D31_06370 [Candidatus Sericytochromatia bacterium]
MIAPRNIRRVNINGRIGREQQLLWSEQIILNLGTNRNNLGILKKSANSKTG